MPVGIFVNEREDRIREIQHLTCIQAVQLHGDESPEFCQRFGGRVIKAFQVKDKESLKSMAHYRVGAFLLDSYRDGVRGGTGVTFDWHLAVVAKTFGKIILAGGLTPENVAEAVKLVQPYGVDVAGGVEKEKGIKDQRKGQKVHYRGPEGVAAMSIPDKKGHFGIYGGKFAPETLMPALAELEAAYLAAKKDKAVPGRA